MDKYEEEILSRLYQSYVMGGDVYSYAYNTENAHKVEIKKGAIKLLEEKGYLEILSLGDKKARIAITDAGIEYGNNNY